MTDPDRRYNDDKSITLVFRSTEFLGAFHAASEWLRVRGFSRGRWQALAPAGIFFGNLVIEEWQHLRPIEREALHGEMTGDANRGPIEIKIYARAPDEVKVAMVAAPRPQQEPDEPGLLTRAVEGAAIAVILAFVLGPIGYVGLRPLFAVPRYPSIGKITLRAGPIERPTERRALFTEARR